MSLRDASRGPGRARLFLVLPLVLVLAAVAGSGSSARAATRPGGTVGADEGMSGTRRWPPAAAIRDRADAEDFIAAESLAVAWQDAVRGKAPVDSVQLASARWWRARLRLEGLRGKLDPTYPDSAAALLAWGERHRPGDALALADLLLLQSGWLVRAGRTDSAWVQAVRARTLRERVLPPADSLVVETWLASAHARSSGNKDPDAREEAKRGIALEQAGAASPRRLAAFWTLVAANWTGRVDSARVAIDSALVYADRLEPGSLGRWAVQSTLSSLESRAGNVAASIDASREAQRVAERHFAPEDAMNWNFEGLLNQTIILISYGDLDGAELILRRLHEYAERTFDPDDRNYAIALLQLGTIAGRRNRFSEAEAYLDRAARIFAMPPPVPRFLENVRRTRIEQLGRQGRYAEANALIELAIADPARSRDRHDITRADLLSIRIPVLWGLRDTLAMDSTMAELDTLLARNPRAEINRRLDATTWSAYGQIRRGRLERARALAFEAHRLTTLQQRNALLTLPDRVLLRFAGRTNRQVSLLVDLARTGGDSLRAAVLDRVVASRGQVLEEIARRRMPAALEGDTLVARLRAEWLAAQQGLSTQLVQQRDRPDSSARAAADALRESAEESTRRYTAALAGRGHLLPPVAPEARVLFSRLAPDEVVVSCVETEAPTDTGRVTVFVSRGGDPVVRMVELGRSSALRAAIEPWLAALATPPTTSSTATESAARRLGGAVRGLAWDPLRPLVAGARTVYVVADGPLTRVPWNALPVERDRYLVERGPAIRVLNAERDLAQEPDAGAGVLVAVGAPDFGAPIDGAVATTAAAPPAAQQRAGGDPCGDYAARILAPLPGTQGGIL